jgi:hypothetical protein
VASPWQPLARFVSSLPFWACGWLVFASAPGFRTRAFALGLQYMAGLGTTVYASVARARWCTAAQVVVQCSSRALLLAPCTFATQPCPPGPRPVGATFFSAYFGSSSLTQSLLATTSAPTKPDGGPAAASSTAVLVVTSIPPWCHAGSQCAGRSSDACVNYSALFVHTPTSRAPRSTRTGTASRATLASAFTIRSATDTAISAISGVPPPHTSPRPASSHTPSPIQLRRSRARWTRSLRAALPLRSHSSFACYALRWTRRAHAPRTRRARPPRRLLLPAECLRRADAAAGAPSPSLCVQAGRHVRIVEYRVLCYQCTLHVRA